MNALRRRITPAVRIVRTRRTFVAALLALLAIVLMALSAYLFRPPLESMGHYRPTPGPKVHYDGRAPWVMFAGIAVLILALALSRQRVRLPHATRPRLAALRPRRAWMLVIPGVLMLYAVAEINGDLLDFDNLADTAEWIQLALLLGGMTLLAAGLGGLWPRRENAEPRQAPESRLWRLRAALTGRRAELALIVLLTVVALAVRFYDLGERVRVFVDEGHFAFGVAVFWNEEPVPLLVPMPTSASFPYIFAYGQWAAVEALGRSFLGLRAFSAILGALTVPAVYLLARHLYDRLTGLLAALILLTFPPHLHYSRLALNNIADPLFGTLALAFLARAIRTNRRLDYALGGVALGLTQYFYEGGRILYPPLVAAWLGVGLIVWRPRPSPRGLLIAALAFVLVAMPVYYTLAGVDFPYFNRLDKTELDADQHWAREREKNNLETRLAHLHHSLAMYVNSPENTFVYYYLYYGGKHPLIQEALVPIFLLGAVIALWGWRTPGVLPLGWVLATSLGNALLVESAITPRYVVVFPALAVLMAAGLRYVPPLIWPGRWPRAILHTLMIAGAIAIAIGQGHFYFGPFLDRFNVEVRQHVFADAEDAMLRALELPPGTQVHLIGWDILPQSDAARFMGFMSDDYTVTVWHPGNVRIENLRLLPRNVPQAFYVLPSDTTTRIVLDAAFGELPAPQVSPNDIPPNRQFWLYLIPPDPTWQGPVGHG